MQQLHHKLLIFLICVALIPITFIAFEPMRYNEFVDYDDDHYVTENPHVIAGLTPESVVWAFTTRHAANWHPLTWLSHMLDCQLFGVEPFWHHLINLLFHIANTLLLFWVLQKMTGAVWRSAFVAGAFALHPLHVESVAWVAERKDVLSTLFWMLTILAYVRYADQPSLRRYVLIILAFSLGLMAKPMLVTLPFVLLLLDYWPLNRFQWGCQDQQKAAPQSESRKDSGHECSISLLIKEKVPLLVLVVVSCIITFYVQQNAGSVAAVAFTPRILNALVSYIRYIEKIIWPSKLAVFYPLPDYRVFLTPTVAALIFLLVLTIWVIRLARSHRYLPVGWLWYLGTLVPVIGIVQVGSQAMADRYTYLPSIGIFIIVAWGTADLLAKWRYRKTIMGILAGLLIAAMLVCTRMQVRHWRNSLTLFGRAIDVTENNYIMHTHYGAAMLKEGRVDEAIAQFSQATRVKPRFLEARTWLGYALIAQGRLDEAINCFNEVLRVDKDRLEVYHNLGAAYAKQGKYDLAIQSFNEALRRNPNYTAARLDLAIVLMLQGHFDSAMEHCRHALRINPKDSKARKILNELLTKQRISDK